jgi:sporulation protein YlmC with PRC-barrel domain
MLRKMKDLKGLSIGARDGDIGEANDFIFDDKHWTVRYLVADTQRWLPGRKVLISPIVVDHADWQGKRLPVQLTQVQVKNSPDISMDQELSAQDEIKYSNYYGFPYYWAGDEIWGPVTLPQELIAQDIDRKIMLTEKVNRSHLRSMKDITGYSIQATDGEIGHVDDFVVDDEAWTIRYIVVDTRNWLPGKKVLVAPPWVANVDWKRSNVYVNMSREAIKTGPEFDPEKLDREYETRLYKHYGQENYW